MGLSATVPARPLLIWHPSATVPDGYIKANGAAISRTVYAWLFGIIGTAFGAGDGSTTFNVPDLRGEFLRGLDDGRGVDAARVLGSWQADAFRAHVHDLLGGGGGPTAPTFGANGSNSAGITTSSVGGTETRPRNVAGLFCIAWKP